MKRRKDARKSQVVVELDALVAFPSAKEAAIIEHIFGEWIERPEVALAWIAGLTRYFDETIVEAVHKYFKIIF